MFGSTLAKAKILFVDDEPSILQALRRVMRELQAECLYANSGAEALDIMAESQVDVVVSDMMMPEMNGAELLSKVAEQYPDTVRLVLSGYSDNESIMSAINEGRIWGYINKPWDSHQLLQTIEHAISTQQIIAERALLRRSLAQYQNLIKQEFSGFVGASVAMQFVYSAIERAAPSNASVFITGASGTGKEVAAQAIHDNSRRKDKPFIALNCAAIPSELMESEIFGHLKGAFSGAVSARDGAATMADGGTLFLDELGEMDINLQAKLLRFIQTGTFQKLGSGKTEKVDIRFICATNRDPMQAIAEQKLREDLFYRLNVISIHLPALAERDQDAVLLARHFLQHYAETEDKVLVGFAQDAEQWLGHYDWPGNVRQLQNAVHSAVVMSQGPLITKEDLGLALGIQQELTTPKASNSGAADRVTAPSSEHQQSQDTESLHNGEPSISKIVPLHEVERVAIQHAIDACEGNVVKAAGLLEVSPSTLYRKVQSWKD